MAPGRQELIDRLVELFMSFDIGDVAAFIE